MIGIAPSKIVDQVADLLERERFYQKETAEKTAAFSPFDERNMGWARWARRGERTMMRSAVEEEEENDQVPNRVMTRSTSNQKKFMDDYANRRMTRSAFKQQQEQKGDEKPQQQQQKKRKNKKKKPVVDDTPKISWGSRYMRYFTPEEREAYQRSSKRGRLCIYGFDVGKYPSLVALSNPISEISLEEPSEGSDYSTKAAKMAIGDYNRKKHTKYQFVKLVRVCIGFCKGWMYYITFQAKQDGMAPSPPRNFQARVHRFMGMHIQFCREEKKPQLTEGPGEPSQKWRMFMSL